MAPPDQETIATPFGPFVWLRAQFVSREFLDSQMGRPRGGKAKRSTSQATKSEDADALSGGDEEALMPAYKRRGRPQKHLKADDDTDEEDDSAKVEAMEDSDDGAKPAVTVKGGSTENGGKKRRRRRQANKRGCDSAVDEKDDQAVKQSGFRHHGSRRKSTPRRAAEAGVECK